MFVTLSGMWFNQAWSLLKRNQPSWWLAKTAKFFDN